MAIDMNHPQQQRFRIALSCVGQRITDEEYTEILRRKGLLTESELKELENKGEQQ